MTRRNDVDALDISYTQSYFPTLIRKYHKFMPAMHMFIHACVVKHAYKLIRAFMHWYIPYNWFLLMNWGYNPITGVITIHITTGRGPPGRKTCRMMDVRLPRCHNDDVKYDKFQRNQDAMHEIPLRIFRFGRHSGTKQKTRRVGGAISHM